MVLTLNLGTNLERRLTEEARQNGVEAEAYALKLLERQLTPEDVDRRQRAIELLRSWAEEGDEQDQRETWEFLVENLDKDRPSYRKLFPPEMKGVSW